MISPRRVGLLLFVAMSAASCARVPFTRKLVVENGLKPDELKNLQFYVSSKVVLEREVSNTQSRSTAEHELKTVKGRVVEQIVINPKTPGVALDTGDGVIKVAFESGDQTFVFRTSDTVPAVPMGEAKPVKLGGQEILVTSHDANGWDQRYKLAADSWKLNEGVWVGAIRYDQKEFSCEKGSGAWLVIKKRSLKQMETRKKVLPGRTLPPATPAPAP